MNNVLSIVGLVILVLVVLALAIGPSLVKSEEVITITYDPLVVDVTNITKDGFDIKSNDSRAHGE